MLRIDHLVLSASSLAAAVPEVEARLGVSLAAGGEHGLMGTHNRLLSLGPGEYLELIAVNPAAPPPGRARWFGLDRFSGPPRLTHFVCATSGLDAALRMAPQGSGAPVALSRGDLRWQMAVTDSGQLPFDDCFPGLISWEGPAHPATRLPDHGLRLTALRLSHPRPDALAAGLRPLLADPRLEIVPGPPGLSAVLTTPEGEICL